MSDAYIKQLETQIESLQNKCSWLETNYESERSRLMWTYTVIWQSETERSQAIYFSKTKMRESVKYILDDSNGLNAQDLLVIGERRSKTKSLRPGWMIHFMRNNPLSPAHVKEKMVHIDFDGTLKMVSKSFGRWLGGGGDTGDDDATGMQLLSQEEIKEYERKLP